MGGRGVIYAAEGVVESANNLNMLSGILHIAVICQSEQIVGQNMQLGRSGNYLTLTYIFCSGGILPPTTIYVLHIAICNEIYIQHVAANMQRLTAQYCSNPLAKRIFFEK